MSETRICTRYGRSLLNLALENETVEEVKGDVDNIINLTRDNRELINALRSPVIPKEVKYRLLNRLFKDNYNETTFKFLNLVIKKGRENLMIEILKTFVTLYEEHFKISHAEIVTATPVDEQLLEQARKKVEDYTDTTVHIKNQVNEDLIGGFVLNFSDKKLDASVASFLKSVKKELVN